MKVLVLTISDRASQGVYEDKSGPTVVDRLKTHFPQANIQACVVSDEKADILEALEAHGGMDLILTTGGTGLGPRDNTPEVTSSYCDRLVPGISEYLRRESCRETLQAVLSRGVAGTRENTLIINLPGSVRGADFCTRALLPILEHAVAMLHGDSH